MVQGGSGDESIPHETVTKRVRRRPGWWWLLALILVPAIIAGLATVTRQGSVEQDLTRRTSAALTADGLEGVTAAFSGRDGTLTVPSGVDAARARQIAQEVTGVRVIHVARAGSSAAHSGAPSQGG